MPSTDRFEIVPNTVPGEKPWLLRRILASGTMTWHLSDTTLRTLHETLTAHIAARPAMQTAPPARCESYARRGTGTGTCDRPLDRHGYCDRANDHIDAP